MFEGKTQSEIDVLIKADPEFKKLYQRHKLLDKKCMDAELGVFPIGDVALNMMKREKFFAKIKLTRLYDQYSHESFIE
ncbi:MAG TPA: YdcH family protein [Xylella sp.]